MGLSLKTGTEPFRSGSQVLQATVLDYWRWSGSDLMNSRERSILGEFLVAMALGLEKEPRLEWNARAACDRLAETLTPNQLRDAQNRASSWSEELQRREAGERARD